MPCPGDSQFRPIPGPNEGLYTIAVSSVTQTAAETTICYLISLEDTVPGPPVPPGISHTVIQLFPGCPEPFPPFTVTVDGVPIAECPEGVPQTTTCYEFPGPFPDEPDIFPAIKINYTPSIEAGESRLVCITVPGCRQIVEGLFRFKAGNNPSFPTDPDCTILTISCEECPQGCERTLFQEADVCTVVTVEPDASCGPVTACCIGDPVLAMGNLCLGEPSCTFTVTQQLCLTIPITFNAVGECSDFAIGCQPPSLTDCTPECTG